MIKALLLIFSPIATWERIAAARRGVGYILLTCVLPILVLVSAVEGYGLITWGKTRGPMLEVHQFSIAQTIFYETAQFVLSLVTLLILARLVKSLGETFHARHQFNQAFTLSAYGLCPVFLLRMLDAFPGMSPWIAWSVGAVLSAAVLYSGLPRVMLPDPPHAFGMFLVTVLLLFIVTGLIRFVTAWYLQGRFPRLDALISDIAARLPL